MSGHFVSRVGSHSNRKCWACYAPGVHLKHGRYFCGAHYRQQDSRGWVPVTTDHVASARTFMRKGWSLQAIAEHLEVSKSDLDLALWANITVPLGRQPQGMF